jgi:hypothetical protein
LQWQSKGTFAMSVKSDKSTHGTSISHFHALESLRETDSQIFSKLLLEELAQCTILAKANSRRQRQWKFRICLSIAGNSPHCTEAEQKAFVTAAIPLKRRERFLSACKLDGRKR